MFPKYPDYELNKNMCDDCIGLLLIKKTGIKFHNTTSAHIPDGYDLSFEGMIGIELIRLVINKDENKCCLIIVKQGEYCEHLLEDASFQQVIKKLLYG